MSLVFGDTFGDVFGPIFGPSSSSGGGGGSGDTTPPTVVVVSPTPGVAPGADGGFSRSRTIADQTPVVLQVYDLDPGLAYVSVGVVVPTVVDGVVYDVEELVYRAGRFRGRHVRGSSQQWVLLSISGPPVLELRVRRAGGWPRVVRLRFFVDAVDGAGNVEDQP